MEPKLKVSWSDRNPRDGKPHGNQLRHCRDNHSLLIRYEDLLEDLIEDGSHSCHVDMFSASLDSTSEIDIGRLSPDLLGAVFHEQTHANGLDSMIIRFYYFAFICLGPFTYPY